MNKIKILPEILSNKIAAGEVVERPCSVVKELIENSLDADSSQITIELEEGGKSFIRISDNGCGMTRDDLILSIQRHATSKIYNDSDLFNIRSMGFRGEALPSIASVSYLSIISRNTYSKIGTELNIEGGKVTKVSDIAANVGTIVTVKQLFFNTPARRKFLKSVSTEVGYVSDILSAIALGKPDIYFKLLHNNKIIKNFPSVPDPYIRVIDVLGSDLKKSFCKIEHKEDFLSISGWTSLSNITKPSSKGIYLFINGRFVKDKIIYHAIIDGYKSRLLKGQYPISVIFIEVPFGQVDVNVHPTKTEVRFANQSIIHSSLSKTIASSLEEFYKNIFQVNIDLKKNSISENLEFYNNNFKEKSPFSSIESIQNKENRLDLWDKKQFSDLKIIGQLHDTYILCESQDGLILIDQHAAHERIVYEQLKSKTEKNIEIQQLLIPETIELGYKEASILNNLIQILFLFGIEIEHFGGNTYVIKSIPTILLNKNLNQVISEIIENVIENEFLPKIEKAFEECLMIIACHSSIRANQKLSEQSIKDIITQLDKIERSSNCPHGRPIWIKWTKKDLEKSFGRII